MRQEPSLPTPPRRGTPIVATWTRGVVCTAALAAVFVIGVNAYVTLTHRGRTLGSLAWLIVLVAAADALLVFAILRAEEARLVRELRTARTGTAVIRALVARRSQQLPILGRLFSTRLGAAAVFLADGDRTAALDAFAATSPLLQGGRADRLREVVGADIDRAGGTASGLERCVRQLRAMGRLGHREADLYRVHVLVKAILEQGDGDGAMEIASELDRAPDEEERMYATWLRVWFELDGADDGDGDETDALSAPSPAPFFAPLAEGQARLATLVARAQGAERLVDKLEQRLLAIARPPRQE